MTHPDQAAVDLGRLKRPVFKVVSAGVLVAAMDVVKTRNDSEIG